MKTSIHFFFLLIISILYTSEATTQELNKGFTATPNPTLSTFQSLLNDSTNTFSLGFLRLDSNHLTLAVLHLPSSEPLWLANTTTHYWSDRTHLFFNGSLVLFDSHSGVFWSTQTQGDKVVLLNTSNLQIQKLDDSFPNPILWQTFDFPTNTLVENQNFTTAMSLVSSNGFYSMRLGNDFIGLYAKFNEKSHQIYFRHKALEAKAEIIKGKGPIYARVESDGFLGMYQLGNTPVDIQAFTNFQRNISGLLILRLQPDGNLKGYYWDGLNWVLNYQAISDTCELPSPCGSYGLCRPGSGCSCLDNRTHMSSGGECFASSNSGDFCDDGVKVKDDFWILRRTGVDLPFKELMRYEITNSFEQCEGLCENNCSCWGALYNNGSDFCYVLDYPIQTLVGVGVGDESKVGYFKVRVLVQKKKIRAGFGVGMAVLGGAIFILIGAVVFGSYRIWIRRTGIKRMLEEQNGVSPGPYKDLGSASFRSIQMCNSNR